MFGVYMMGPRLVCRFHVQAQLNIITYLGEGCGGGDITENNILPNKVLPLILSGFFETDAVEYLWAIPTRSFWGAF